MDDKERKHIEGIVNGAYELKVEDLNWKPLYANNCVHSEKEGIYCLVLHENGDGTYAGRKYTIYNQLPVREDGVTEYGEEPELFILFEMGYNRVAEKEHPDPTKTSDADLIHEMTSKHEDDLEHLTNLEINSYGNFVRAFKNIDDAKKAVVNQYKAVYGFAMSHMLL